MNYDQYVVLATVLALSCIGRSAAEEPKAPLTEVLATIDFNGVADGQALVGEKPGPQPWHAFHVIRNSQTGSVVGAKGGARFRKAGRADGNPQASLELGTRERGVIRVAFRATMESYTQGESKPNMETLFMVRLLNNHGQLVFFLTFLGTPETDSGSILAMGAPRDVGEWQAGKAVDVELAFNIEAGTYDVEVSGEQKVAGCTLNVHGAIAHLQFGDGSGINSQDGTWSALVDDVHVTYEGVGDTLLERHRTQPPVPNPAPTLHRRPVAEKNWTVPGKVTTTWVGNTFPGAAEGNLFGQNGFGEWVQNGIAPGAFVVTPDGTAIAGVEWDEAGRCIGLYKGGRTNPRLVAQYDMRGGHNCWGFGSANHAVAADGEWLYASNLDGHLLRFRWTPGELDSHTWVDQLELGKEWVARSVAARDGMLAALFDSGVVRVWKVSPERFEAVGRFTAPEGASAFCFATDGGYWFVADGILQRTTAEGKPVAASVVLDAGRPTAVSVAPDGTLAVCDGGPRQQVRFYDVAGAQPKLVKTFGDEGGLRSGTPGTPGPHKLYGLVGAGVDGQGNVYVGCCLTQSARGTAIKAFDRAGTPLWDVQCHAFTDGYSFDPAADGIEILGVDEFITLDLAKPVGQEWSLKALTVDPLRYPDDARLHESSCTGLLRYPGGRRLLYTIGMMSGGFNLFAFEDGPGHVAYPAGEVKQQTWAWEVDAKGDVWLGDPGDKTIKRYRFLNWGADGKPLFSVDAPDSWPAPDGLRQICRVHYDCATDTLYVGAFPDGVPDPAWGEIGAVLERHDGWTAGKPQRRWRIDVPRDDEKLYPKAMDIVGDYAFVVQVKTTQKRAAVVSVFSLDDGAFVGEMWPGKVVGGFSGWVDISHGIRAHKRRNGEYIILVEEDFRGKNIMYRWTP